MRAFARRFIAAITVASSLSLAAACADTAPTAPDRGDPDLARRSRVTTIVVSPSSATLATGTTRQFSAEVYDQSGRRMNEPVTWYTTDINVASVSESGVATALRPGSVEIKATAGGVHAGSYVTVVEELAPVVTVTIDPGSATIDEGGKVQLTAVMRDGDGNVLEGRAVSWRSANASVATVSATGEVTGVAVGSATIVATSEGRDGSATITVSPPPVASVSVSPSSASLNVGEGVQLVATMRDANGNTLSGRSVSWQSSNSSVATVSSTGYVSAVASGTVTITATSEGQSGTASVSVSPTPVASVTVTPSSSSLVTGEGVQLSATVRDANGNVLSGRTVTWSSSNTSVATVSSSGYVSAVGAGAATITATSEGRSGTASVDVSSPVTGGGSTGGSTGSADILFKDFEDGSWGTMSQPYGTPGSRHEIVTDAANCRGGSRCYRYTIPSSAEYSVNQFYINGGQGYSSIYYAVDFKITAPVMGQLKGLRFVTSANQDAGGTYFRELGKGWAFGVDASNVEFALGIWSGARDPNFDSRGYRTYLENMIGGNHRLVIHYERSGAGVRARFWINGTPIVQPQGPAWGINGYTFGRSQGGADWVNGNAGEPSWLVSGTINSTSPLNQLRIFDQLSHTYGASNGFIYLDNLTLSTQPIQP